MAAERSTEIFKKIAVYGGVASVIGASFCYHRIQANLASQEYYKKSVEVFRKHNEAVNAVGKPVGFRYMRLGGEDVKVNNESAKIVIPLRGSKSTGNLHSFATKQENKGWTLDKLELEVNSSNRIIKIVPAEDDQQDT